MLALREVASAPGTVEKGPAKQRPRATMCLHFCTFSSAPQPRDKFRNKQIHYYFFYLVIKWFKDKIFE